jgi:energy-coupling factor transport system permease protein
MAGFGSMAEPWGRALPRALHPGAWWLWAIALAVVASRTSNPLLLGLIIGVAGLVVMARREDAPWGRAFGLYLRIGLLVVALRVAFRILLGGDYGTHLLFSLPAVPLPDWMAGVRIGGAVTAESLLAATYDGLRLAALIVCFGAANSLANPKRVLRLLPNALYEIGASITVALSVAPQLAESVERVRRARRLRGGSTRGRRGVRGILLPVLEDALERSISLAAAMDARGYGRVAAETVRRRRVTAGLLVLGLVGACIGMYGLLDASAPFPFGLPGLVAGVVLVVAGLALAGRRTRHTRYRPDAWRGVEWAVLASGAVAVVAVLLGAAVDPAALAPSIVPLEWPAFAAIPTIGILVAALPTILAPVPPLRAAASERTARRVGAASEAART